jgi:ribosome-binding factor A
MVTITSVKLSSDLRIAQISFSVVEGKERSQGALAGFQSAKGYLKRQLGRTLYLKHMPELRFVYDESFDRAAAMNRIFKAIESEHSTTVGEPAKE